MPNNIEITIKKDLQQDLKFISNGKTSVFQIYAKA